MANPLETYIENVVTSLQTDYPDLMSNIRKRADKGEYHLEAKNLDLEVGIRTVEIDYNGQTTDAEITASIRIRWTSDRPSHYSFWDSLGLATALASWLSWRDVSANSRRIARTPLVDTDPLQLVGQGRFHYEVTWADLVEVTSQFDYEGHVEGPLPRRSVLGDEVDGGARHSYGL